MAVKGAGAGTARRKIEDRLECLGLVDGFAEREAAILFMIKGARERTARSRASSTTGNDSLVNAVQG